MRSIAAIAETSPHYDCQLPIRDFSRESGQLLFDWLPVKDEVIATLELVSTCAELIIQNIN